MTKATKEFLTRRFLPRRTIPVERRGLMGAPAFICHKDAKSSEHVDLYISWDEHRALLTQARGKAFTEAAKIVLPKSGVIAGELLALSLKAERGE